MILLIHKKISIIDLGGIMDLLYNGKFYLIARYFDNHFRIVNINLKNYLSLKEDYLCKSSDLSFIDLSTIKFSYNEFKEKLLINKVISSSDVDLYIVKPVSYHNKIYLKEYELLYKNNFEKNLVSIINNRLNNTLEENDYDMKYINDSFLSKISYNNSFYYFVINSDIDKYFKDKIKEYKNRLNSSLKYYQLLNKKFENYSNIHLMISLINNYEDIKQKYDFKTENELRRKIDKEILLKRIDKENRKKIYNQLLVSLNKSSNIINEEIIEDIDDDLEFLSEEEIASMTNNEGYKYTRRKN